MRRPSTFHRLSSIAFVCSVACDPADDGEALDDDDDDFRQVAMEPIDPEYPGFPSDPLPPDPDPAPPIDNGHACQNPATVYVGGNGRCSGVLIAPDMVLTAGHCVRDGANLVEPSEIHVGTGATTCYEEQVRGERVWLHDAFDNTTPVTGGVPRIAAGDLALVRLSGPVLGATPATLGTGIPGTPSANVTITGFSGGTQRCGDATIVASQSIQVGPSASQTVHVIQGVLQPDGTRPNLCVGDSGGPVYQRGTNVVVAINSLQTATLNPGGPPTCSGNGYAAVDWDWVQAALDSPQGGVGGSCTVGAVDNCRGPNDTCMGEITCGRATCGEDGTWGQCVHTIDTVRDENHLDICNLLDDDCDGTVDEDCVVEPTEPCPPGQTRDPSTGLCTCSGSCEWGSQMNPATCQCEPVCGDSICAGSEPFMCPEDCGPVCGDGECSWQENEETCPWDCGDTDVCICGWDCPPNDPECAGYCGDGVCDLLSEDSSTCPWDCGYTDVCVCGWDCPPNHPGCGGGGDPGGGDDPWDMCGDWGYWDWYGGEFGWDEAVAMYESMCAV